MLRLPSIVLPAVALPGLIAISPAHSLLAQATTSTAPSPTTQPATAPTIIPAADLQSDAQLLRRCVEAVHPGLYRYNTPAQFEQHFAELMQAFSRDRTRVEAFVELSRFTAAIRCGHTFPNPYNQGKSAMAELTAGRNRLPFRFRWIDRRMIVTGIYPGAEPIATGTEVLAINAAPAAQILDAMFPLARADGGNDAKRISQLELRGEDRYEIFDFFFTALFPTSNERLELRLHAPTGEERTRTVPALSDADRKAAYDALDQSKTDKITPLWTLERRGGKVAYLRMPSWVAYNSKWDWKGSIRSIFDELAASNTPNLIIDLRGNEGGTGVGDEILARLITTPIPWSDNERFVHYVKTPPDLRAALDTWDDSFHDRSKEILRPVDLAPRHPGLAPGTTEGFYLLQETNDDGKPVAEGFIQPVGPRYTGRVFVLVNAENSSATFFFAKMAQNLRVATLVGQPTGGNQRGINGGAYFFVRLPASRLEVDLPQIGYFPKLGLTEPRPDAGVTPDVLVPLRAEDIATGRDAEMEASLALIQ
jgi:hypothetical protein